MLLLLRKLLFYLLLALYLVITPYVILYGLGYKLDPSEGEILKTGLVSVVTEPPKATVYLEGKKFYQKTPTAIRGLRPGNYHVKIVHKGFKTWEKTVEIFPEKASRLEPVILLPDNPGTEFFSQEPYQTLLPTGGEFKFFGFTGEELSSLRKFDLLFRKTTLLGEESKREADLKVLEVKTKPDSEAALLKVQKNGQPAVILYDLDRGKMIQDVTSWVSGDFDGVDWPSKKPDFIYTLKEGIFHGVDFETRQAFLIDSDVFGFGIKGRKIYFLKNDHMIWESNLKGDKQERLPAKNQTPAEVFNELSSKAYHLEPLNREIFQKELFLFLGDQGQLISNWSPYHLVEKGVRGFKHSVRGDMEKILYWTKEEIGVFDLTLGVSEEEEVLPEKKVLFQSGSDIRAAFWAYDSSHIIFQDKNSIFILEAGETEPYLVRLVAEAAEDTTVIYHDIHRTVYFLDPQTRKLSKRRIPEV